MVIINQSSKSFVPPQNYSMTISFFSQNLRNERLNKWSSGAKQKISEKGLNVNKNKN